MRFVVLSDMAEPTQNTNVDVHIQNILQQLIVEIKRTKRRFKFFKEEVQSNSVFVASEVKKDETEVDIWRYKSNKIQYNFNVELLDCATISRSCKAHTTRFTDLPMRTSRVSLAS